ncbi:hypothetical protein BDV96DRAFT_483159 [Lophiotrema nucula]|uniref:DUF7082 domain-containing protein n=1 Tax=Lophiotrema nucula TaxID=690887 RepID=A0A6A5ZVF2_9PLEO|nr:hypothetical protein BDV96DRAFT_483159 [Lophiotrema nucula]
MSGYGKNQEQYVYDAAATRPNQVPSYEGFAQPSFASQYTNAPAPLSHEPSSAEMPFIPSSTYESRAGSSYQAESSFIDAGSRHPASHPAAFESEITNAIAPSQGTAGSTIILHLKTKYDLVEDQLSFAFMFGKKRCVAAFQKIDQVDDNFNYALSVEVPPFPTTGEWNPTMMLELLMENRNGGIIRQAEAGKFTYTDMSPGLTYQPSPEVVKSGKRKFSGDYGESQDYQEKASKRANTYRLQKPRAISVSGYPAASGSPLPVAPPLSGTYGYSSGYDLTKPQGYSGQLSKSLYAVPSGSGMSQGDMKPPLMSPNPPSYGAYSTLGHTAQSPASIASTPVRQSVMASPSAISNPVLVRATTLPQAGGGAAAGQPFNPYLMYPSKAVLKVDGDLDTMTEGWTPTEIEAKRRLVQFERSQSGSTITTSFAPVTPEARPARSICVSCILWEEKDECFITSVDTIYLLESLVNVRFTVEEKNRIRRNLEGFRPQTVSKAKSDSEEFFKVIMGFPNPKPRNIEKDVKVFPWKILSHALKKIISKYSASYSSTAGAGSLPSVTASSYLPVGIPQGTGDSYRNTSPRSVASTVATTAYTPSLTTASLSPNMRASAGLEGSAAQGMPVPQGAPTGQAMTQWGSAGHHQMPQYSGGLPASGRGSWDYGAFLHASAATGVPSAAQSMQVQRSDVTHDMSQLPTSDNPYQQYGQRTTRV